MDPSLPAAVHAHLRHALGQVLDDRSSNPTVGAPQREHSLLCVVVHVGSGRVSILTFVVSGRLIVDSSPQPWICFA